MSQVIEKLYERAAQQPNSMAFYTTKVLSGDEINITYGELAQEVKRVSDALLTYNVTCLAIELENSYEWLVADLAALASGIACLPVPMFFTQQQKDYLFDSVEVDAVVSAKSDSDLQTVAELSAGIVISAVTPRSDTPVLKGTHKVTFTSGSTGTPKGVCLSDLHLDQASVALASILPPLSMDDKHLVMLPLSTLLENITGIYVPILVGSASVIMDGAKVGLTGSSSFDVPQFAASLAMVRPATLVLTPALLAALVAVADNSPELVTSLKFVAVGGAKAPVTLLQQAHVLELPVFEGYGLSECASVVCVNTPKSSQMGTVGFPLPHVQVQIAPDGEIRVSPPGFLGYLNEPFTDNWYATGDLGEWTDEGLIKVLGRKKNTIVTRFGRNISPEWIETHAYQWPELRHFILAGEIDGALCGVIVSSEPVSVIDSLSQMNATLPDYARIESVVIVSCPQQLAQCFTQNSRPIRNEIYQQVSQWVQRPDAQMADVLVTKIIKNQQ